MPYSVGTNYFGVLDYISVGLTVLVSLGIGIYHAVRGRGEETSEDLLMGGRKMSPLPIAASMVVTFFSAVNIIGKCF
jgi:Na+/proline symporter